MSESPIDIAIEILRHMLANLTAERELGYNPEELHSVIEINHFIQLVPNQIARFANMRESGEDYPAHAIKQLIDPIETRGDEVLLDLNHELADLHEEFLQEQEEEEEGNYYPEEGVYEEYPLGE